MARRQKVSESEAYQKYLSLGPQRSLALLAKEMNISVRTAEIYSSKYQWQIRLEESSRQKADETEKQILDSLDQQRQEYLQMTRAAIRSWFERFEKGEIKVNSTNSFQQLVKVAILLMDQTQIPNCQECIYRHNITFTEEERVRYTKLAYEEY